MPKTPLKAEGLIEGVNESDEIGREIHCHLGKLDGAELIDDDRKGEKLKVRLTHSTTSGFWAEVELPVNLLIDRIHLIINEKIDHTVSYYKTNEILGEFEKQSERYKGWMVVGDEELNKMMNLYYDSCHKLFATYGFILSRWSSLSGDEDDSDCFGIRRGVPWVFRR